MSDTHDEALNWVAELYFGDCRWLDAKSTTDELAISTEDERGRTSSEENGGRKQFLCMQETSSPSLKLSRLQAREDHDHGFLTGAS